MGRKESLQSALANYIAQVAKNKLLMREMKKHHKVTWWIIPSYWKAEKRHHKAFHNMIIARRMIATDELKERNA